MNSYVSYSRQDPLPFPISATTMRLWILRDSLMIFMLAGWTFALLLRWTASRSLYISNRSKMIASGEDILTSFCVAMACSGIVFFICLIFTVAVILPLILLDFGSNPAVILSFFAPEKITTTHGRGVFDGFGRYDLAALMACFGLCGITMLEHLARKEIVWESILLNSFTARKRLGKGSDDEQTMLRRGRRVIFWFSLKRQMSSICFLGWAVLFFCAGLPGYLIVGRIYYTFFSILLLIIQIASFWNAAAYLYIIVKRTPYELSMGGLEGMKVWGRVISPWQAALLQVATLSFKLRWDKKETEDDTEGKKRGSLSILTAVKQCLYFLLWHTSGETFAAAVALVVIALNFPPLIPMRQIYCYTICLFGTLTLLVLFWPLLHIDPICLNTSGDEIPSYHLGFGMLVSKKQLFESRLQQGSRIDLIPATIERIFECVTISYRWEQDADGGIHVKLWNREEVQEVQITKLLKSLDEVWSQQKKRRWFKTKVEIGLSEEWLWLDTISIDQKSTMMKMLLVPKMTACYALSSCTVAIDNSLEQPRGCADNYYSRAWTFQEFCLPPSLLVFAPKAFKDSILPDSEMRRQIQDGSWLGGEAQTDHEFHSFLVVGTDSDDDIRQRLLD